MARREGEAKQYIREARRRLLNMDYSKFRRRRDDVFFVNNKRVTDRQLEAMNDKVKEIMCSEEFIPDPLDRLIIDKAEFSLLDEGARLKYMLEISSVYLYLQNKNLRVRL